MLKMRPPRVPLAKQLQLLGRTGDVAGRRMASRMAAGAKIAYCGRVVT